MSVNILFLDMNSYFASVEQQHRPELRGKPVAVVPVMTDSTCCIAASYEAKAFGIRTGTNVGVARRECPGLALVEARPELYVQTHHAITKAVEQHLPIARIDSIDEMWCKLLGKEREPARAIEIASDIKRTICRDVGAHLRSSVGLAPNRLLAKVAADMQKPDGLTVIEPHELPHKLYTLELQDFPGVGPRMLQRLHRHNIFTVEQFCALSEHQQRKVWESVLGGWWFRWLRGEYVEEGATHRRSVGHSHVLAPALRTDEGAAAVMMRLIHKAAARLRTMRYWAGRLHVQISYGFDRRERWSADASLGTCRDTLTMIETFQRLWATRPRDTQPVKVSVALYHLTADRSTALPLFTEEQRRVELAGAIDKVNMRFGANSIYFGGAHLARDHAPTRIAFGAVPTFDPVSQ